MPCCNNECLENINAACIDYTGTEFQCISTDAENLQEILIDIDSKLCDAGTDISTSEITIDTKCITGDCPGQLQFRLGYIAGATQDLIVINITGINLDPIIYDDYIVTVNVYSGNTIIATTNIIDNTNPGYNPITFPSTWNNGGIISVIIDLVVGNGISPYHGIMVIPQNSMSMVTYGILNCTANTVITTTVKTLFEMIIGKICDLQNQINVLGG